MRTTFFHIVLLHTLAFGCLLATALPVMAGDPPAAQPLPAWEQLTPAQREVLIAPLRGRWNADPARRQHMFDHAQRWRGMTPEQRRHAHHGMKRWENMSPEQRTQMRALYSKMRTLEPGQRQTLKDEWRAMTPEQRKAWVQANPPKPRPLPPPGD